MLDRRDCLAAGRDHSLLEALFRLADDPGRPRIFVTDRRAVVALILVFALPNVIPVPPGTSAILGTPLLFLTVQLALGKEPWAGVDLLLQMLR
jgi:hypothetical protein